MFLKSVHYFRAIAIFIIVLGHSYSPGGFYPERTVDKVLSCVIKGGTSLFVFISGFLFYHVFYPKYRFRPFMKKKVQVVFVPYLLMSIVPLFLHLALFRDYGQWTEKGPLAAFFFYMFTGKHVVAYWYIPFALCLFLASPAAIGFINSRRKICILTALFALSMIVHRPLNNINVFQSFLYFFPVYLLGIAVSMHYEKVMKFLKGKVLLMSGGVFGLAWLQIYLTGKPDNLSKKLFVFNGVDVMILQKVLLCLALLSLLDRFQHKTWKLPSLVADSSFAVFFLHCFWLSGCYKLQERFNFYYSGNILTLIAASALITGLSVVSALVVKRLVPKRSRLIIGW